MLYSVYRTRPLSIKTQSRLGLAEGVYYVYMCKGISFMNEEDRQLAQNSLKIPKLAQKYHKSVNFDRYIA